MHPAPDDTWKPALSRSVRFRHGRARGADVLLRPERVEILHGHAGAVLKLCDGHRDVAAIVAALRALHPDAPVTEEVAAFLARLRAEGWLS
ncbi:pyrroloquinoline quinone biosynthesis peptide chaperone PqqD [Streptomyces coeruleoprunus]|uniref:Pyrroloquinoline quinone biosynthesis peptide chaperone PqqD n=1 Tax=Streptomyces coeruleoprunus TaxID=285563 RepID=A0ABV9XHY0_9ACTN